MTGLEFAALLARMTRAAEAGDGAAFTACFTEDGVDGDMVASPWRSWACSRSAWRR